MRILDQLKNGKYMYVVQEFLDMKPLYEIYYSGAKVYQETNFDKATEAWKIMLSEASEMYV